MPMVAIEQFFPNDQRIIVDDWVRSILSLRARASLWVMRPAAARDWLVRLTEKTFPGLWSGMMISPPQSSGWSTRKSGNREWHNLLYLVDASLYAVGGTRRFEACS